MHAASHGTTRSISHRVPQLKCVPVTWSIQVEATVRQSLRTRSAHELLDSEWSKQQQEQHYHETIIQLS